MNRAKNQQLNYRQRKFLQLYTGRSEIAGNATQCYKAVYAAKDERCAQVGGSRLLRNPVIANRLEKAEQKAIDKLSVDATFVLQENMRLYKRSMGDEAYDSINVTIDPVTGQESVQLTEQRNYDPATAHKALTSIGQHKDIQAFTQTVEHNHTHVLEQRLAARSKVIEGRALRDDVAQLVELEPGQATIEEGQKRVHQGGGQTEMNAPETKRSSEREGAEVE